MSLPPIPPDSQLKLEFEALIVRKIIKTTKQLLFLGKFSYS